MVIYFLDQLLRNRIKLIQIRFKRIKMKNKLKITASFLLLILISSLSKLSSAGPISFSYSGTCNTACSDIGLTAGSSVFANFLLAPDDIGTTLFERTDVESFTANFGSIIFSSDSLENWDFMLSTNLIGEIVAFQFLGSFAEAGSEITPANSFGTLDLRPGAWFASNLAGCSAFDDGFYDACDFDVTTVFGLYGNLSVGSAQVSISEVPLPSTVSLFCLALALMLRKTAVKQI
jgi:hypothetical protein